MLFVTPHAFPTTLLVPERTGEPERFTNPPVNLALVHSFQASTTTYHFAGQSARSSLIAPCISFYTPDNDRASCLWIFNYESDRDTEYRYLIDLVSALRTRDHRQAMHYILETTNV